MRVERSWWLALALALAGCVDEHDAVVQTAAHAAQPWPCPGDYTRVDSVGYGRYQLMGCNMIAVYACNFAPPFHGCWRER